jgi:diguanylate cyclase (GGDEF)-like protein
MLDVDHFKGVNDRYGHAAGDEVLIALARRIGNALRAGDVFGRLGGEEFAVVTMPCSRDDADVLAERLRSCIDSAPVIIPDGTLVSVTISLGYAYGISDPDSLERFMAEADKALYAAKAAGRNRTMGAPEQHRVPPSGMVVPFGRTSTTS